MSTVAKKITQVASIYKAENGTTYWVDDACQRQFSLTPSGQLHYDFCYLVNGKPFKIKTTYQEIVDTVASWGNI